MLPVAGGGVARRRRRATPPPAPLNAIGPTGKPFASSEKVSTSPRFAKGFYVRLVEKVSTSLLGFDGETFSAAGLTAKPFRLGARRAHDETFSMGFRKRFPRRARGQIWRQKVSPSARSRKKVSPSASTRKVSTSRGAELRRNLLAKVSTSSRSGRIGPTAKPLPPGGSARGRRGNLFRSRPSQGRGNLFARNR